MHNLLTAWNPVFPQLSLTSQKWVIKEEECILDSSKQPGNLRFRAKMVFPRDRMGGCFHDMVLRKSYTTLTQVCTMPPAMDLKFHHHSYFFPPGQWLLQTPT